MFIISKEFGEYLRSLRKRNNLTLVQLSDMSGVSQPYLSHIENGKRGIPSPEILRKLYKPLEIDYTRLLKEAGYVEDEEMLKLLKEAQKEKVYRLKGTQSSYMVDLSNLGEELDDLEEMLKATLYEPLFYGKTQLTTDEQQFIIDFIELLLKHRTVENN